MATYPPPNYTETLNVFNPSNWIADETGIDTAFLNSNYLRFPVAQGLETLQDTIVNGDLQVSNDKTITITDGITTNTMNKNGYTTRNTNANATHYLNFSDNSATGTGAIQKTAGISCNPSTNSITATSFIGTATNATDAVNSTKVNSELAGWSSTSYIPFFVSTSGNQQPYTNNNITCNPSIAKLNVGTIEIHRGSLISSNNCFLGSGGGFLLTTGDENIGIGVNSGNGITTGLQNVGIGTATNVSVTSGSYNMSIGANANNSITTGSNNLAIGTGSGGISAGSAGNSRNVSLGTSAGGGIIGNNNVSIGYLANSTSISCSSSVALGSNSQNTKSNQIMLGTTAETVKCPGCFAVSTLQSNASINLNTSYPSGNVPRYVLINNAGTTTITLPSTLTTEDGTILTIKNIGAGTSTVQSNSGSEIRIVTGGSSVASITTIRTVELVRGFGLWCVMFQN